MSADPGLYTIGAAAHAAGLTTYAIRMWERRYGAVVPPRTPGRGRLYSQADVDRLTRLRKLTEAGHAIRHVARLTLPELDTLLAAMPAGGSDELVPRFLGALADYDVAAADALLARAAALLGPRAFVTQVAMPVLAAIGDRWGAGDLRIYQEHTASAMVRSALYGLLRAQSVRDSSHVAIATTLTGEDHQLGALMAALIAATVGWRVIALDDHAPASDVRDAAADAGARAVLVSFIGAHRDDTQRELDALIATLPADVALLIGGRTARSYVARHARARVVQLDELDAVLGELALRR